MKSKIMLLCVLMFGLNIFGGTPIAWDIKLNDSSSSSVTSPYEVEAMEGETLDFMPRFLDRGKKISIDSNAFIRAYFREYGTTNTFVTSANTGTVYTAASDRGRILITIYPNDLPAMTNQFFIGLNNQGMMYRAWGKLSLIDSPGINPTTNENGRMIIDWSTVDNVNVSDSPFQSDSDIDSISDNVIATSNLLASAIDDIALLDDSITGLQSDISTINDDITGLQSQIDINATSHVYTVWDSINPNKYTQWHDGTGIVYEIVYTTNYMWSATDTFVDPDIDLSTLNHPLTSADNGVDVENNQIGFAVNAVVGDVASVYGTYYIYGYWFNTSISATTGGEISIMEESTQVGTMTISTVISDIVITTNIIQIINGDYYTQSEIDSLINGINQGGTVDIYSAISNQTATAVIISNVPIYRIALATTSVISNDLSNLAFDGNMAKWEVWVNYTHVDALDSTWQANAEFCSAISDVTCTGLYKYACSSIDGITVQVCQIYPTYFEWDNISDTHVVPSTGTDTNSSVYIAGCTIDRLTIGKCYLKGQTSGTHTYSVTTPAYSKVGQTAVTSVHDFSIVGTYGVTTFCDIFTEDDYNAYTAANVLGWSVLKTDTGNALAVKVRVLLRRANELEESVYNAGLRFNADGIMTE